MKKRSALIFTLLVATVILGVCIGIPLASRHVKRDIAADAQASATDKLCRLTSFPVACNQTLAAGSNHTAASVTQLSLQSASGGVNRTRSHVLALNGTADADVVYAVDVCLETLMLSQDHIAAALTELQSLNETSRGEAMHNVRAWVSAAMEFHTTCVDAVLEVGRREGLVEAAYTDQLFSNALAFVNAMDQYGDDLRNWKKTVFSFLGDVVDEHVPGVSRFGQRRLLAIANDWMGEPDSVPGWVDAETEGHLLGGKGYDVMVAKDGRGSYETIQAAVDAHEVNSRRLVIYVKAGTYNEQVSVPKTCKYLTIVGDGDATVLTGDRSVAKMPGMKTFKSATLIVTGEGFLGKSFLVRNTAGAEGQQAVAFRGSADMIALYKVTFDGYQDTLYAHAGRHYYRECTIRGTVDFIFGNAAASFQSCTVVAKKTTLIGQQNTYTAQGRTDPHQSTGLSFQNCVFDGTAGLKANTTFYKTYLGRPWKAYSVCVVLKSELRGHIDPTGWSPWNTSTFGLHTSYFAEYQNFGAGATPATRVNWSHQISLASVADKYTANNFVHAGYWTRSYHIPLTTAL